MNRLRINSFELSIMRAAAALVAVAALTGCSGSESSEPGTPVIHPVPEGAPMQFASAGTSAATGASRADTWVPLQTLYSDFGIYAWKIDADGARQDVMLHDNDTPYKVAWDAVTSKWVYEMTTADGYEQYLKYWDNAALEYHFEGSAPYIPAPRAGAPGVSFDPTNGVSITGIAGNVPPSSTHNWAVVDMARLVVDPSTGPAAQDYDTFRPTAAQRVGNPLNGIGTAAVPLQFHSLMSGMAVAAFVTDGVPVDITSLEVSIASGGIATTGNYANHTLTVDDYVNTVSNDGYSPAIHVDGTTAADATTLVELSQIMQDVTGKDITFIVGLADGRTVTGTFTLDQGWEPGLHYTYYLKLSSQNSYIFMEVDVDTYGWISGDDIEPVDGPVINW